MKRFLTTAIIMGMMLCAAGCSTENSQSEISETDAATVTETTSAETIADKSENEGVLKTGVYSGSSAYSEGEFSMTWNYTISFNSDNTFTLTDDAGEDKGSGTYALTDNCYTMTYSDERTCTFVVQADGTIKVTSDMPYGQASITPEMVDGIILTYSGEAVAVTEETTEAEENIPAGDFTITVGTYTASYTKKSPMAGTVVYNYTAEIGTNTFSYNVSFEMGDTVYDGSSANGTYTVDSGKFVFTDESGTVTEGILTADNTLVISLMASEMAKEPYEVTFVIAE